MKARRFNALMPRHHELWAAAVLNMRTNPDNGPDLIDDTKLVEIKFTLVEANYPLAWTVLEHQVDYRNGRAGYWGFGEYALRKPVSEINETDIIDLESLVVSRKLHIVNWDWIYQFTPSRCTGRSTQTEWDNTYRYPRKNCLPKDGETFQVEGGTVILTRGVPKRHFKIKTSDIPF